MENSLSKLPNIYRNNLAVNVYFKGRNFLQEESFTGWEKRTMDILIVKQTIFASNLHFSGK